MGPKVSLSSDMPSCQAEREAGISMKYFTSAGSSMWAAQLAMKKLCLQLHGAAKTSKFTHVWVQCKIKMMYCILQIRTVAEVQL